MKKTKITTFVGTRPEIIRLSSIIKKLDKHLEHRFIHTGQNPDPQLKDVFFTDLNLREPDLYFPDNHSSLGGFLSTLFIHGEKELIENRPDALLILGDTNSALISVLAKRLTIPIYHLEAGNRSFDANVPEEINRKIVDHVADFNFPYSEQARRNLLDEGLHPRRISLMGSPLKEVFDEHLPAIKNSNVLSELKLAKNDYILVSIHRQENVDIFERLQKIYKTLEKISEKYNLPILVSTHPRTRKKIEELKLNLDDKVIFHKPFGFLDYNCLQINSRFVLSDSGTISEEAAILGFKAITMRDSMERPEALELGSIVMSGIEAEQVLEAMRILEESKRVSTLPTEYFYPDVSTRLLNFILSTVHLHDFWAGIRR